MILVTLFVVAIPLVGLLSWLRKLGHREPGLPPGPPTRTIFGNVLEYPRTLTFVQHSQWASEYGEIYSLKLLNDTMIILTSGRAVKEILDKLGLHSGDRPKPYVVSATEGVYAALENMDSQVWKASRKAVHSFLTPQNLASYWPMQQLEYFRLLHNMIDTPDAVCDHIRAASVHLMSTLVYGTPAVNPQNDKWRVYYDGVRSMTHLTEPFAQPPVDKFPLLQYVPARFAKWKRLCEEHNAIRADFFDELDAYCDGNMRTGQSSGGYLERILAHPTQCDMSRNEVKSFGRVLMDGGIETSAAFLQSFVLALTCHPDVQKKAQEEIDSIIGEDRLPTIEDFDSLPYLNAIVKEVHRFRPMFPGAIPHVATKDLRYGDYVIPKNAIIIQNTWGIFHDPNLYEQPDLFIPERYLESEFGVKPGADPDGLRDTLPFGAGRRICPGAEMGTRTISMITMYLVWGFSFVDKSGSASMDLKNYHIGAEIAPKAFSCNVTARNVRRCALMDEVFVNAASLCRKQLQTHSRTSTAIYQNEMVCPKLPTELWLSILTYLPRETICELRYLNNVFYETAMDQLYETFVVESLTDHAVAKFRSARNSSLARRVKKIEINMRAFHEVEPMKGAKTSWWRPFKSSVTFGMNVRRPQPDFRHKPEVVASMLLEAIKNMSNVQHLYLRLDTPLDRHLPFLRSLCSSVSESVRSFQLRITGREPQAMWPALIDLSRLRCLSIELHCGHDSHLSGLHSLISTHSETLQRLSFNFDATSSSAEYAHVLRCTPHFDNLKQLDLGYTFDQRNGVDAIDFLNRHLGEIEELSVRVDFSTETLNMPLSSLSLPKLRKLKLSLSSMSAEPLPQFFDGPTSTNFPLLTCLTIHGSRLLPPDISTISGAFDRTGGVTQILELHLVVWFLNSHLLDILAPGFPAIHTLSIKSEFLARPGPLSAVWDTAHFAGEMRFHKYPEWSQLVDITFKQLQDAFPPRHQDSAEYMAMQTVARCVSSVRSFCGSGNMHPTSGPASSLPLVALKDAEKLSWDHCEPIHCGPSS